MYVWIRMYVPELLFSMLLVCFCCGCMYIVRSGAEFNQLHFWIIRSCTLLYCSHDDVYIYGCMDGWIYGMCGCMWWKGPIWKVGLSYLIRSALQATGKADLVHVVGVGFLGLHCLGLLGIGLH